MKRIILLFGVLTLTLAACVSPGAELVPATVTTIPPSMVVSTTPAPAAVSFERSKLATVERDVTYCTMGNVPLKMDLYYPGTADGPWPAVIYVHGGSWVKGSKSGGTGMGDQPALTAAGFLFVSIDYRLAPEHMFPAMIQDVKCAVRYLRAHAAQYNLDPERIGALGESAGGHLVSLLGLSDPSAGWDVGEYIDQSSRVQAVVDYFGPADLTDLTYDTLQADNGAEETFGATEHGDPLLAAASPVTYATPDDPPFLIVQGEKDTVVPAGQSQILYERLKAIGIPVTLVMVKNAGHLFAPIGGAISPTRAQITQMAVDFFTQQLK
jgi:acetyl esterase/lipase